MAHVSVPCHSKVAATQQFSHSKHVIGYCAGIVRREHTFLRFLEIPNECGSGASTHLEARGLGELVCISFHIVIDAIAVALAVERRQEGSRARVETGGRGSLPQN